MKKILTLTAFLIAGLVSTLPAKANPAAEQCLNKVLESQRTEMRPKSAELLVSIEHEGSQYHLLRTISNFDGVPAAEMYLKTDSQGGCKHLMSYLEDSFPTQEEYNKILGAEVNRKIDEAYRVRSGN